MVSVCVRNNIPEGSGRRQRLNTLFYEREDLRILEYCSTLSKIRPPISPKSKMGSETASFLKLNILLKGPFLVARIPLPRNVDSSFTLHPPPQSIFSSTWLLKKKECFHIYNAPKCLRRFRCGPYRNSFDGSNFSSYLSAMYK